MRTETAGGAYADQIANVLTNCRSVYGTPGEAGTLENALTSISPPRCRRCRRVRAAQSAQITALTAAQALAQQLNATTQGIQTLRSNAEQDINISVGQANAAMAQIAQLNTQLQGLKPNRSGCRDADGPARQRDRQLSQLMDIRVSTDSNNQINDLHDQRHRTGRGMQASHAQLSIRRAR